MLEVGEAAPAFQGATLNGNANYVFNSVGGRPVVLLVLGSGRWAPSAAALALLARHRDMFDDERAVFFGVSMDRSDADEGRIARRIPGIRWFLDYDAAISTKLGAIDLRNGQRGVVPHWLLLDATLRVAARASIDRGEEIFAALTSMIAQGPELPHAPVLMVPRVVEPGLCRRLIALYEEHGGTESGFMREENGVTVGKLDHSFKRRSDYTITDAGLRDALLRRLRSRLVPQIRNAFQFDASRIERWIVACYDADSGGFFRPHRDNTTAGTAHRAFACTINLNAEGFEGGELRFPEYGPRSYRAPTGGAVIFSCSLLHEALPVTRGKRYAFLPFLYNEEGARLRERNQQYLEPGAAGYRSGLAAEGAAAG